MAARKSLSDDSGDSVYDSNRHELSESYKRAIGDALPRGVNPSPRLWNGLADEVGPFLLWEQRRADRPPRTEVKRWQRIDKLVVELGKELRELQRSAISRTDDVDADDVSRPLQMLARLRYRAKVHITAYDTIGQAFAGRKNPHRENLYRGILRLWTDELGQSLSVTMTDTGARGPLIRFFRACAAPLGIELAANGVAKIVRREKSLLKPNSDFKG